MNRVLAVWRRVPAWVGDLLAVAVAVADTALYRSGDDALTYGTCVLACAVLLIRRRFPLTAFALTLPAALVANIIAAPIIALFSLSARSRRYGLLVVCGALFAAAEAIGWPLTSQFTSEQDRTAVSFVYQFATAAAPILLGQLMQATADLRARITEIEAGRQHERELYAQTVLARERNQLAREMHDVVSHQVSLIAVQAAALQVTATDPAAREASAAIRTLASTTLEELRSMVLLLRAAGTQSPGLAPQPTASDLDDLIAASGMPVEVGGELPADLGLTAQRAVYRTVQEALTNVRKHAPGSTVAVWLWSDERAVGVTIVNGRPTEPPLGLPSAQLGLLGLRERAELLGGSLSYGSADGGFGVRLRLPRAPE